MTDLQKLLVIVPSIRCDAFRTAHIIGATSTDPYWNRISFLEDTHELYTHGQIYGASGDIADIKAILAGYGTEEGARYATVQDEIDAIVGALTNSNLINLSYTSGTGYSVEDTVSLTYETGYIGLGGGTSYSTALGDKLAVADSKEDIEDTTTSYVATTSTAVREYVESKLGDIANAVTLEGDEHELSTILDAPSGVKPEDVGNQYIMSTSYTFWFPKEGEEDAKQYNLEAGDSVLIKTVDGGVVTGITAVERNLDGAVTASAALTANQVVIGDQGDQSVKASGYVLGTDADTIDASSSANTLATEKAVAAALSAGIEALDSSASYNDNYISYSYTQVDGKITEVTVSTYIATADSSTGVVTGNGLIDATAATNLVTYLKTQIDNLDESFTTVDSADSTYITVTYSTRGNDYAYTVGANIVRLGEAVGMTYDTQTGQWVPGSGNIQHGLADAADVAQELVADEEVIAAVLNNHEERIQDLEEATGGISINGNADTLAVTYNGLSYTLTPTTAAVTSGSAALVTGGDVYTYVGTAIGGLDVTQQTVSATGSTSVNGFIGFSYSETDGIVNISGLSYQSSYVSVSDNLVASVTRDGLVTGQLLADVINALNPWEEYSGEQVNP